MISDGSPEPEDHPRNYVPTARPGHRAPHLWLDDGSSILDHFGAGFTLLVFAAAEDEAALAAVQEAARDKAMPMKTVLVREEAAAAVYGSNYALIRPDLMVAWRGDGFPEDCRALLDTVCGNF